MLVLVHQIALLFELRRFRRQVGALDHEVGEGHKKTKQSSQAHDVKTTSCRRRCDVIDVDMTFLRSCACWSVNEMLF